MEFRLLVLINKKGVLRDDSFLYCKINWMQILSYKVA